MLKNLILKNLKLQENYKKRYIIKKNKNIQNFEINPKVKEFQQNTILVNIGKINMMNYIVF